MTTHEISVPTTAATIFSLLGGNHYTQGVSLIAPSTNGSNVYFGSIATATAPIEPGQSVKLWDVRSTHELYIKGSTGDKVTIVLN